MEWTKENMAIALRMARRMLKSTRPGVKFMPQYEFAEMIGASTSTVCEWEVGRRKPRGPTWRLILIELERRGITFNEQGFPVDKHDSPKRDSLQSSRIVA